MHSQIFKKILISAILSMANMLYAAVNPVLTIPAPVNSTGFGHSLAVSGNELVVGDYARQVMYRYNAAGSLQGTYQKSLVGFPGLGLSVAFDGQWILAGGPLDDTKQNTGPAVLFDAASGQELQTLTGPLFSYYGWGTAIAPTFYAVGARGDAGRTLIYDRASMTLRNTLNGPSFSAFGASLAAYSNQLTVGAPGTTVNGLFGAGKVFLYNADTGQELRTFISPNSQDSEFGWSVAQRNGQVLIGAPYAVGGGAAYLFDSDTGVLLQSFHNPIGNPQDGFGWSVAFANNSVIVGAPNFESRGNQFGAAYAFDIGTGSLLETLLDPFPRVGAQFGWAVAGLGDLAVVSSNANGVNPTATVYVYAVPEPASLCFLVPVAFAAIKRPRRRLSEVTEVERIVSNHLLS